MSEPPGHANEIDLLLTFLRERDVRCPRCGYNLRNLTQPTCPECREALSLKVDVQPLVIRWLLMTIAPGMFCAIVLGIFLFLSMRHGSPGGMPTEAVLTILFVAASATASIALAVFNRWFTRQPEAAQVAAAVAVWLVHVAVFLAITARM